MTKQSKIQWTDRTWNPVRGCSRVSEGCRNCYAERQAARFANDPFQIGSMPALPFDGFAFQTAGGPKWTGRVELIEEKLLEPMSWRKPARVFVNSMSDLFHESLPDSAIDQVFSVMALAGHHTFQVLTKRPQRMRDYAARVAASKPHDDVNSAVFDAVNAVHGGFASWPLSNVWLGVSVEDQATADARIPILLQTPAALRFVSYEPALGPVSFKRYLPPNGYTLGNPQVYETALDMDPSLEKQAGGAYFPTIERANAALEDGRLPRSWFPSENLHGKVYALHGAVHDNSIDSVGSSQLIENAPISRIERPSIDWLIVGGESGPQARESYVEWIRDPVEQCLDAGVAVFVKQLGSNPKERLDADHVRRLNAAFPRAGGSIDGVTDLVLVDRKGGDPSEWPEDLRVRQFPEVTR